MAMNGSEARFPDRYPYWLHRCPFCRQADLVCLSVGSAGCTYCGTIYSERWLVGVLRLIDELHGRGR